MSYNPTSNFTMQSLQMHMHKLNHKQCRLVLGLSETSLEVINLKRIVNASSSSEINDFIWWRSSPSPSTPTTAIKIDGLHVNRTDICISLSSRAVLD